MAEKLLMFNILNYQTNANQKNTLIICLTPFRIAKVKRISDGHAREDVE